ncbi:MAG: hypothetical protein ACYC8T_36040 [Myxococcaceae bacterium]
MSLRSPLLSPTHDRKRKSVLKRLPELELDPEKGLLSLHDSLDRFPESLFDRKAYRQFLSWLSDGSRAALVAQIIEEEAPRLSRALRALAEINSQEWHDQLPGSDMEGLLLLDRIVHPAHLRLLEPVLKAFLHLAARVSRRSRGVGEDGLEINPAAKEVRDRGPNLAAEVYDHVVRNAIAHGGIEFRGDQVVYTDSKAGSRIMTWGEMVGRTDDLLDTCNGLALALKVFLLSAGIPRASWPREVLLRELQCVSETPWWKIEASLPSNSLQGSQLNIYAVASTHNRLHVVSSAIQTAALAEALAPGFDRYFISIRSPVAGPGWAGFAGAKLAAVRRSGAQSVHQFVPALEESGIFYFPRRELPKILSRADTFRMAVSIQAHEALLRIRETLPWPHAAVRHLTMHTDPLLVIHAWAVCESTDVQLIRESVPRIMRLVSRRVLATRPLLAARPAGLTQVSLYSSDRRRRQMLSYGHGPDLIATLTRYRDKRKRVIDIEGSRVETISGVRVAWNSNWPALGTHLARRASESAG